MAEVIKRVGKERLLDPVDLTLKLFKFPIKPYDFQKSEIDKLAWNQKAAYYWEPGTGKTLASTIHALHWFTDASQMWGSVNHWFVVVPPILIPQWEIWLNKITYRESGEKLKVTPYAGTPAQRQKISLDTDFLIMSYQILKQDYDYLYTHFKDKLYGVLADEATAVKNHESITHKAIAHLADKRPLQLLTGTPLNKPNDAYAYLKLVAPHCYSSKRAFDRAHVEEVDEWGNTTKWKNLDQLTDYMKINTSRLLRREVRKELPPVVYTPLIYNMHREHMKLYERIAEERLVEFEDKDEIDAISASALRSALQQIIVNWAEFDGDPARKPAVLDIIEEILEELGDKKLVIVANFRRSNRYLRDILREPYGAVAIYGDVSTKEKQDSLRAFITDPKCRVILLHPESAGFGVDGLQQVCSDMLIVEAPTTPIPFQQVVARLDRDGQNDVVHVRTAIARDTVQVGMFRSLMEKDALANRIQGGYKNLKDSIYGR